MEKDLHYYGTYTAAILAGYNEQDAQTISYAAQYVDDSTLYQINSTLNISQIHTIEEYISMTPERWQELAGIDFVPIITSQTNTEIFFSNVKSNFTSDAENELRKIWCPFHFLPGNFDTNTAKRIHYNGCQDYESIIYKWKYGLRSQWELNLLCQKSSSMVQFMIDDIINNQLLDANVKKVLIGIRMHVLADTWSHMWYAGTPSWCMNEAAQNVYNNTNGKHDKVSWGLLPGQEVSTPPSVSFYSAAYLGHGRMGHLPDLPWLEYQYKPQWSSDDLFKSNPSDFLTGVKQMVTALKCIRENKPFNVENLDNTLDINTISNIYAILSKEQNLGISDEGRLKERCSLWKENISQGIITQGNRNVPEDYNPDTWNKDNPNFKNFHIAAKYHQDSIIGELANNGIDLCDPPPYDGY